MSTEGGKKVEEKRPLCRRHYECFREGSEQEFRIRNDVLASSLRLGTSRSSFKLLSEYVF